MNLRHIDNLLAKGRLEDLPELEMEQLEPPTFEMDQLEPLEADQDHSPAD